MPFILLSEYRIIPHCDCNVNMPIAEYLQNIAFGVAGPEANDTAWAQTIHKDGAIIEYLQYSRLDVWFGQETPWLPAGPR
jgi:hypothetical protein